LDSSNVVVEQTLALRCIGKKWKYTDLPQKLLQYVWFPACWLSTLFSMDDKQNQRSAVSLWIWPALIGIFMFFIFAFQLGKICEVRDLNKTFISYIQTVNDFGGLHRYQPANNLIATSSGPNRPRVVFFGDSITDFWSLDSFFRGKDYANRGISGQTTQQMLVRFQQDVLNLRPAVVVILAGGNDIRGITGPMRVDQIEQNIQMMAELARLHGIHVVVCSILPVSKAIWPAGQKAEIIAINTWLKSYAETNHYLFVDYYDALTDDQNNLPDRLSRDGIHPLPSGYAIMAPLVENAIEKALAAKG
jgi:acyl-CoA thioesterase I